METVESIAPVFYKQNSTASQSSAEQLMSSGMQETEHVAGCGLLCLWWDKDTLTLLEALRFLLFHEQLRPTAVD